MAMKSPPTQAHRPIRDLLRRLIKAPASLSVVWPILLVIAGYVAWHRWGAQHLAEKFYGVELSQIEITDKPDYVRSDVVKSVYFDTKMEGLSLLDPQATAKIAAAFSMNPWVKRVVSVRKLPGSIVDVRVQYRRPVAMVLVEKPNETRPYFYPVDSEGVLLPTVEFAEAEVWNYIHIIVPDARATGSAGFPFGDLRVESAARLASVLADYREQADIVNILVPGDPRVRDVPLLEISHSDEKTRFWGSPPGMEYPGEDTVDMKLQRLLNTTAADAADLRMASRPEQ